MYVTDSILKSSIFVNIEDDKMKIETNVGSFLNLKFNDINQMKVTGHD